MPPELEQLSPKELTAVMRYTDPMGAMDELDAFQRAGLHVGLADAMVSSAAQEFFLRPKIARAVVAVLIQRYQDSKANLDALSDSFYQMFKNPPVGNGVYIKNNKVVFDDTEAMPASTRSQIRSFKQTETVKSQNGNEEVIERCIEVSFVTPTELAQMFFRLQGMSNLAPDLDAQEPGSASSHH